MNKLNISKYILFISIFTFLAVFFYVVQNSYSKLIKPIKETEKSELIKPINSHLNIDVLDQIEKRNFNQNDNLQFSGTQVSITPVPTI